MSAHYKAHIHADFIECNCGHLSVTECDFGQHVAQMRREYRLFDREDRACADDADLDRPVASVPWVRRLHGYDQ